MAKHEFRTIQGYPSPKNVAPYFAIIVNDAHATIQSIYRGDDARAILNKHGHHSQWQLAHATAAERAAWGILGTPDAPGQSTHELKSDGHANTPWSHIPVGHDLAWWMQGMDVLNADAQKCINAAARYGWELFRPYGMGVEYHHLNFRQQPKPTMRTAARIIRLRTTLPRS